jgi:hypothetical protein
MITWRGQQLDTLTRGQLEDAAGEAVSRLMTLQQQSEKREQSDAIVFAAVSGMMFAAAAIASGVFLAMLS